MRSDFEKPDHSLSQPPITNAGVAYVLLYTCFEEKPARATAAVAVYRTEAAVEEALCYAYIEEAEEWLKDEEGDSFYDLLSHVTNDLDGFWHVDKVALH